MEPGMRPWKPRPFSEWPEELKKIKHLKGKKWERAVLRVITEDLILGENNLKVATQRLDKRLKNADN